MRTALNIYAMRMASLISSSECFKNSHSAGSWNWHWHERLIREVASHIANMPYANNRTVEKAKIFGALENLEKRLFERVSRSRQKV